MSDWLNWKEGDMVECLSKPGRHNGYYTPGTVYAIGEVDVNDIGGGTEVDVMCDSGFTLWCPASCFKFHSRPTA